MDSPALFKSGSAQLTSSAIQSINKLSNIIGLVKNPIIIEGHTDNVPIKTDKFGSNWELSFYRAYAVVKYLIEQKGFSPQFLSAVGYGEFQPLVNNDTAEKTEQKIDALSSTLYVSRVEASP